MRLPSLAMVVVLCICLYLVMPQTLADVSQLVRSGNGFVYDVPKINALELEISNDFPTGDEFPQDAIPVALSDAELGVNEEDYEATQPKTRSSGSEIHGYEYQVPSKRFKS